MFDLSGLLVVLAVLQLLVVLEWIPLRSFVPSPWNLSVVLLMGFAAVIFLVIGGVMYSLADRHREA
jgi:F0F1-type ATP synthase assembly protein I